MGEIDVRLAKEGLGIPGNVARPYIYEGGDIGRGAANLGRGVQRLGHDLDRLNARLATDRATKAGNLLVQRDIYVDGGDFEGAPGQAVDHFEGLIHQTGENGLNVKDVYRDKFNGLRAEIAVSQGLKGRELEQFNIQADAHFDRQMKRLIAHQKRQYDVVNDQVTESTLATYQTSSVQGFKGEVADSDAEYTRQKDELAKLPVPATQAVTDEEGLAEVSQGDYHTMQSNTIQNNWNERWKAAVGNYNSQLQQGCDALEVRLMEKGVPKQTIADTVRKYREQSAQRLVSELVTSEDFGAAKRVVEEGDAFGLNEAQREGLKKKVADSEQHSNDLRNRQADKVELESVEKFNTSWNEWLVQGRIGTEGDQPEFYHVEIDGMPISAENKNKLMGMVNKHFAYLHDQRATREKALRGEMDANGYVDANGEFVPAKFFASKERIDIGDELDELKRSMIGAPDTSKFMAKAIGMRNNGLLTLGQWNDCIRTSKALAQEETAEVFSQVFKNPRVREMLLAPKAEQKKFDEEVLLGKRTELISGVYAPSVPGQMKSRGLVSREQEIKVNTHDFMLLAEEVQRLVESGVEPKDVVTAIGAKLLKGETIEQARSILKAEDRGVFHNNLPRDIGIATSGYREMYLGDHVDPKRVKYEGSML